VPTHHDRSVVGRRDPPAHHEAARCASDDLAPADSRYQAFAEEAPTSFTGAEAARILGPPLQLIARSGTEGRRVPSPAHLMERPIAYVLRPAD